MTFALADFLKLQTEDSMNGLFDVAQGLVAKYEEQKVAQGRRFLLFYLKMRSSDLENQLKSTFNEWRLKSKIQTLQLQLQLQTHNNLY